jgi:hypothetical protein
MKWFERALLGLVCLAVGWFDVWTVRSNGDAWRFGQDQDDYYNEMIHGWLDGQLAMKVNVPPALARLADPYDPRTRPAGLALHDASFYRGKYYLYFGAAPAVVLLLPFRLVTGVDLPLPVAEIVFVYAGFLLAAATWLAIRRRYFQASGTWLGLLGVAVLGVASLGPMLLRRPRVWELPIAAGYGFAMLALFGVWRALHSPRRARWLALAALALGLAIGSRPTYLFATPLLAVPLAWWWREQRRPPWREVLAAFAPLAAIGVLLAWHNYARFGDALEFGQKYQLSLDYESKMAHFSPRYAAFNFRAYFLSWADWSRYFPFIAPAPLPTKPGGMGGNDGVYGVLANLPLAWLALAAPLAIRRRTRSERHRLAAGLGATAALFAGPALVVVCFFGTIARYELDFTPALILLAGIGWLAVERDVHAASARGWLPLFRTICAGLAVFSIVFGILCSIQLNGFLAERNQRAYRDTARLLNRVPAAFERLLGVAPVAREFDVRLPSPPAGTTETLLSVGNLPDVDRVFVRYVDASHIQLGLARPSMPDVVSAPLAANRTLPHHVRATLGAFLPPDTHPWFEGLAADAARRATRIVRLEWDGVVAVSAYRRFEATAGGRVRIGAKSLGDPTHPRFSGEVMAGHTVPLKPAALADSLPQPAGIGGTFQLRIVLPRDRTGASEPMVVTGSTGRGDVLGIEYLDAHHVRFFLDHWSSELRRSEPREIDYLSPHDVVVTMPGLGVPSSDRVEQPGELRVQLDGETVWAERTMGFRADPEEVALAQNPIGGSNCGPSFTGRVLASGGL